jgi:hypothetical protein
LEKVAVAAAVAILLSGAIYWIIQIRDVIALLETA